MQRYSKISGKKLLLILLFLFAFSSSYSQSFAPNSSFNSHWQIQISTGTSLFFGDIKQYQWWPVTNYENEWRAAFGFQLAKQISPVFGLKAQGLYGQLAGTRREWNKHFKADYIEFNVNTSINLINIFSSFHNRRLVNPYLILGIGLTNYNTDVFELGTNKLIQSVGNGSGKGIGGRTLEGVLIGGLGVEFRLNDRLSINLESSNRIMNSDLLDGYVSNFKYDVYNNTNIGIAYKFGFKNNVSKRRKSSPRQSKTVNDKINTAEYDYNEQPIESPVPQPKILIISPDFVPKKAEKKPDSIIIEEQAVVKEVVEKVLPATTEFEYRVQIMAKHGKAISINHLSNIYNIPVNDIRQNTHNGYFIYSIGSFSNYEDAKAKRNQLRINNGIIDAFVVAFNNGTRLDKLP